MSWPTWFTDELGSGNRSRTWIILAQRERYSDDLDPGGWAISSTHVSGYTTGLETYTPKPLSLTPRQWRIAGGGFSLTIRGEDLARLTLTRLRPGSVVGIYIGKPGMAVSGYARLQCGQLISMTQEGFPSPLYKLEFAPHYAALRTRPADSFANRLFNFAGGTAAIDTTPYTAGDTTLNVTGTTLLNRQAGGDGVVQITPSSGEPFYLKFSASTGTTLTVGTTGEFGTTAVNASVGDVVTGIVYLNGHPASIVRRLLQSSGTADFTANTAGDNGAWDVYPKTWGFDLLSEYVDLDSFALLKSTLMTVSSGNYQVELLIDAPIANGVSWLSGWLAPLGMFLREHQGQLSAWAVQNPEETASQFESFGVTSTDLSAGGLRWSPMMPDGVYSSSKVTATNPSGVAEAEDGNSILTALPLFQQYTRDLTGIIRNNSALVVSEALLRMKLWDLRRRIDLGCSFSNLGLARMGCGGLTHVSLPLFGPDEAANGTTLTKAPAIITGGPMFNPQQNRVVLGLTLLPEA